MLAAPTPVNEDQRLEALRACQVLDSSPEQVYDDLTHLASFICHTPISLISLVDEDRQWFKSKVGIDAETSPREVSFCGHAICDPGRILEIPDATQDPRFADNPFVTEDPNIRFYAGSPLVDADGNALGTLCVIDKKPRKLSQDQLDALDALGRQAVAWLELRRTSHELQQLLEDEGAGPAQGQAPAAEATNGSPTAASAAGPQEISSTARTKLEAIHARMETLRDRLSATR
ncbi:MAG: GAF domain-containing protein [Candidatus Thermoplasmatota archaeon]|nr:GAF domain-containing protein [Candidatus Thermoplasmatota archaeon]